MANTKDCSAKKVMTAKLHILQLNERRLQKKKSGFDNVQTPQGGCRRVEKKSFAVTH